MLQIPHHYLSIPRFNKNDCSFVSFEYIGTQIGEGGGRDKEKLELAIRNIKYKQGIVRNRLLEKRWPSLNILTIQVFHMYNIADQAGDGCLDIFLQ